MPLPHVVVPDRRPPGLLGGVVLGVPAGLFLAAIWLYGEWDVALALTAVFAGLMAVLLAGAPGWRSFGAGLLPSAVVTGGLLALIAR